MSQSNLNSSNELAIRRQEQNRIAITRLLQQQHRERVAKALDAFKSAA